MSFRPAPPLEVVAELALERGLFVELLGSLGDADWLRATECPAYDVAGIAAHVLGDDLSLLSRQRDGAAPGLLRFLDRSAPSLRGSLDAFNDDWVETATFLSPRLLVELLDQSGRWTHDFYASVDPLSTGERVGFFGATGPSPYWQISAREFVERWVHHHQIRRAVGRPAIDDERLVRAATAAVVRGAATRLGAAGLPPGRTVVVSIDPVASWTLVVSEAQGWAVFDGRSDNPSVELRLVGQASLWSSHGLAPSELEAAFSLEGDEALGRRVLRDLSAVTGR